MLVEMINLKCRKKSFFTFHETIEPYVIDKFTIFQLKTLKEKFFNFLLTRFRRLLIFRQLFCNLSVKARVKNPGLFF